VTATVEHMARDTDTLATVSRTISGCSGDLRNHVARFLVGDR